MTAALTPVPKIQFFADDGTPLVGGKLYSYAAGTTTPLATYTAYAGTVANTNPVILDSRGEANVWLGAAIYKLALYDADNALIWTVDNITPEGDASLVTYLPAGTGAVVTTVQAKLRESVSVADFGAVGDGVADDTAAIQAALDHVQSLKGGVVNIPTGTFKITSMLSVSVGAVTIIGAGYDNFHGGAGIPGVNAATTLKWAGADGGTMLKFFSLEGINATKQNGGGIQNIYFNSGATISGTGAGYGVQLIGRDFSLLRNLFFYEFQTAGLRMGCATQLFDVRNAQFNQIEQCGGQSYSINVAGSIFLLEGDVQDPPTAPPGSGATYLGANVCTNTFLTCYAIFKNGEAWCFKNTDHNFVINGFAFRHPLGTGSGIAFHGSNYPAALNLIPPITTLNGAIDAIQTSITVTSVFNFDPAGVILVDSELISYSAISTNTLTGCVRGAGGTIAASHLSGSSVTVARANNSARKNVIHGFSGGGVIKCYTTATYLFSSANNIFTMLDDSNNTPFPTDEAGNNVLPAISEVVSRTNGVHYFPAMYRPVAVSAGTLANAESLAGYAQSRLTTESLRVENGQQNGIRIARPATDNLTVTSEFEIAPTSTLNLAFNRIVGAGVVQMTAGLSYRLVNLSTNTTLINLDCIVLVTAVSGSCTITLPLVSSYGGPGFSGNIVIRRIDNTANTVTVQRQGSDLLNTGTSETLAGNSGKNYVCNGSSGAPGWFSF